jgi:tRNA-modifying protein YgfZ
MTGSFSVLPARDLLWVRGQDAVSFLDGIVSQSVAAMAPGEVRRSLLLTPRGKLDALLWLLAATDRVGVVVEGGHGERVAASLGRFKIRVDAEIVEDDRRMTEVWGADLVESGTWIDGDIFTADVPLVNGSLRRVLTTAPGVAEPAPLEVAEAVRIAAGEPRLGVDIGEDTIPQEGGVVAGAVDFTKGCYLGQELVARIDSRGHVNRQLRGLRLEAAAPEAGPVTRGGKAVGVVTSTAVSAELGPIALAMVRSEVEVGDEVDVAGVQAVVTGLPIS